MDGPNARSGYFREADFFLLAFLSGVFTFTPF
jgi:hypothetical protein